MTVLVGLGDSQTDYAAIYGVRASETWCPLAGAEAGFDTTRAFGISGDTSAQVLARVDVALMQETPDVVALAVGVNDPGATITQAQTQTNVQAALMALKHGAVGLAAGMGTGVTVAGQANLPVAREGTRLVVLADTSTSGGVDRTRTSQAARITGSVTADSNGQKITVWEATLPLVGEFGWRRVATRTTTPTVVTRILVVPPPYRNWTSGGDTPSTPDTGNANVRAALTAAVAAENVTIAAKPSVAYSDLYAYMKARITSGADPNFSADTAVVAHVAYDQTRSWHYTDGNQHYSVYGHFLQKLKVAADIGANWPGVA